jgi:WXXGXW repeat (2 copies)
MKTKFIPGLLLGSFLLASSALFAGPRVSIGVGIGVPVAPSYYVAPAPVPAYYGPPAPAYVAPAYVPPPAYLAPAPGYSWISGYWYFSGGRRLWRPGYWAAPRVHVYAGHGWRYRR